MEKRRLYHNCAGNIWVFLTVCREMGFPTEGYWEIHHLLQQQILPILSELSNVPVKNMAITYLKLFSPELI
ncbi:asparaginase [Niallia alba]|uniref:asparaginase n=1 Tax=Niallia alba TaxID=2729105 RepID=UPI00399CE000